MRSWLRPSLRYGSTSTMPLARSVAASAAASTVLVEVDRRGDVAAVRGVGDERRRVARARRPSRRRSPADVSQRPAANSSPPLPSIHCELVVEQEERRERGRVVGLVEPRVLERDRQVERRRHPAVARVRAARCARSRRASRARATGRRRSRSTSAARSSRRRTWSGRRACRPRPTCRRRRRARRRVGPVQRHHHAGRRLVVRVRVHVALDVVEQLRASRRARSRSTCGSSRCGAPRATAANFDENSPITRCELRRSMSPNAAASQNSVEPPMPSSTS